MTNGMQSRSCVVLRRWTAGRVRPGGCGHRCLLYWVQGRHASLKVMTGSPAADSSESQMPTTAYSSTHALTSSCCIDNDFVNKCNS